MGQKERGSLGQIAVVALHVLAEKVEKHLRLIAWADCVGFHVSFLTSVNFVPSQNTRRGPRKFRL